MLKLKVQVSCNIEREKIYLIFYGEEYLLMNSCFKVVTFKQALHSFLII